MISYVLGFAFSRDRQNVILIEKQKPEWQAGLLNGVGGKIEQFDETPTDAMVRQFEEETGVNIPSFGWDHYSTMLQRSCKIYCFRSFTDYVAGCETKTAEEIIAIAVKKISEWPVVPSIRTLLPMALDVNIKFSEIELT